MVVWGRSDIQVKRPNNVDAKYELPQSPVSHSFFTALAAKKEVVWWYAGTLCCCSLFFTVYAAKNLTQMKHIGLMVRYHRKRAGLSRVALARLAGVGKTLIYDIEHGKDTVQWKTLNRVLHALNIRVQFDSPLMATFYREQDATG